MKNLTLGWIDLFFYLFFFIIKAFLAFTYKIETKKEKKEKTHTHIVQIEEYQAKHTHKAITAMQLPRMQITMPSP